MDIQAKGEMGQGSEDGVGDVSLEGIGPEFVEPFEQRTILDQREQRFNLGAGQFARLDQIDETASSLVRVSQITSKVLPLSCDFKFFTFSSTNAFGFFS